MIADSRWWRFLSMIKRPPCGGSSERRSYPGRNISMVKVGRINLPCNMESSASRPCGWWTSAAICGTPTLTLTLSGASLLCLASRPLHPNECGYRLQIQKLPPGYVDDVSRMNKTKVSEVWDVPGDGLAAEEQIRCGDGHLF